MPLRGNDKLQKNNLVKMFNAKTKCKKKSKEKKLMQIKRQNFTICKMSMGGNDSYKNKLVKYSKLKQNAK